MALIKRFKSCRLTATVFFFFSAVVSCFSFLVDPAICTVAKDDGFGVFGGLLAFLSVAAFAATVDDDAAGVAGTAGVVTALRLFCFGTGVFGCVAVEVVDMPAGFDSASFFETYFCTHKHQCLLSAIQQ
jgi:hypothetical protein